MSEQTCAAPGCDNRLPQRLRQVGRPPFYCSVDCRVGASRLRPRLAVEIDQSHDEEVDNARQWVVRLRRGRRVVVLGTGLGRFSASALATGVASVIGVTVSDAP